MTFAGRYVRWAEIRDPYNLAGMVHVVVDTANVLERREFCSVWWPDEVILSDGFGSAKSALVTSGNDLGKVG